MLQKIDQNRPLVPPKKRAKMRRFLQIWSNQ